MKRSLPQASPNVLEAIRRHATPLIDNLLAARYRHEAEVYNPFLDAIRETLSACMPGPQPSFHNTSRNTYLNGRKPDLTISLPGIVDPDPFTAFVVFEMKLKKDRAKIDTDKDLGQLMNYLLELLDQQSGRRFFIGILSDIARNVVVLLEVKDSGWNITQHHPTDIYSTLAFLSETALVQPSHHPPDFGFSPSLGNMRRRLGNPHHSVVGEFVIPDNPAQVMAVKRSTIPSGEIALLRSFLCNDRPSSIPYLVHVDAEEAEFGITPVGLPLVPGAFVNAEQARTVLTDVHGALCWLHERGIVHRDVRCGNIIVTPQSRGVLIDFDSACDIRRGSLRFYRGGYLCCPRRHLRNVLAHDWSQMYTPAFADDWHAFVLLINCMIFPSGMVGFRSNEVGTVGSPESWKLLALWDALEASSVWGPFVKAAVDSDVETLKSMVNMFVWV